MMKVIEITEDPFFRYDNPLVIEELVEKMATEVEEFDKKHKEQLDQDTNMLFFRKGSFNNN